MDNAVAIVQAFLRLQGYLTVTEFPVVAPGRAGGSECVTDLDILAFRFRDAAGAFGGTAGRAAHDPDLLGAPAGAADMIIGEVKEGRAELNAAATRHEVLATAIERFGCCEADTAERLAVELVRHGRCRTSHGHFVRLVAFGSTPPGRRDSRIHVVLLGDMVAQARSYISSNWAALQASASKEPGLSMLLTLEKAERGRRPMTLGTR